MNRKCNSTQDSGQNPGYTAINAARSVDAFREESIRRSRLLYPSARRGRLFVELHKDSATTSATALISEHRPAEGRQYALDLCRGQRAFQELPAGGYTVVVREPGYAPYRTFVEVAQNQDIGVLARLEQKAAKPPSFPERLEHYGIDIKLDEPGDLTVDAGTRLDLGSDTDGASKAIHVRTLATIEDAKRILGQPDHFFPANQPRFGKMVGDPRGVSAAADEMNLLFDTRFAFREYIYGNSTSVKGWREELQQVVATSPINFPIWVYRTVTVGPHAVLNVGAQGLVCDKLRVHYTGKVRVSGAGPTVVETGTYEQFGWLEVSVVGLADEHLVLAHG